jgi:hypothetical protein
VAATSSAFIICCPAKSLEIVVDPFSGDFNGNKKIIAGLYINRPNEGFIGLFGIKITLLCRSDISLAATVKFVLILVKLSRKPWLSLSCPATG